MRKTCKVLCVIGILFFILPNARAQYPGKDLKRSIIEYNAVLSSGWIQDEFFGEGPGPYLWGHELTYAWRARPKTTLDFGVRYRAAEHFYGYNNRFQRVHTTWSGPLWETCQSFRIGLGARFTLSKRQRPSSFYIKPGIQYFLAFTRAENFSERWLFRDTAPFPVMRTTAHLVGMSLEFGYQRDFGKRFVGRVAFGQEVSAAVYGNSNMEDYSQEQRWVAEEVSYYAIEGMAWAFGDFTRNWNLRLGVGYRF